MNLLFYFKVRLGKNRGQGKAGLLSLLPAVQKKCLSLLGLSAQQESAYGWDIYKAISGSTSPLVFINVTVIKGRRSLKITTPFLKKV